MWQPRIRGRQWRGAGLLLTLSLCALPGAGHGAEASLRTVDVVDLKRYAGTWHEIARLPNRFQRQCVTDTTATYTIREDGKIEVLNACRRADGSIDRVKGVAKRASKDGPASRLRVTFFWPFYGNYWIIDLDPDYRWAVVGEPKRRYLWVLAREPQLDAAVLEGITARAQAQGYDLSTLLVDHHP
jgi:apolipoprotein D and lipocalin family protein